MPNDETARARAEQEVNNAHQGDNDARQVRNDSAQVAAEQEPTQAQTNLEQAQTNVGQGATNTAQEVTNTEQLDTNAAQGDTNIAQGITNTEQLNTNDSIRETIKLLAKSVDANTASMEAVSNALRENLELYTKIDARLTDAESRTVRNEQHAAQIEETSDRRTDTFRRMWITLAVTVLTVGLGGFSLNAYQTRQLCIQRNEASASSTQLVQEQFDKLTAVNPNDLSLLSLSRFLDRSTPVNCNKLF